MSSTPAPTNAWYITDDFGSAGLGSGLPIGPTFVAATTAAATQTAYLIATALQMGVRLVNKFNNGGAAGFASTAVAAGPANTALTVAPSGNFATGF